MGVKYFDKVYARPASPLPRTNASLAGYTLIPQVCKVTGNVSIKASRM